MEKDNIIFVIDLETPITYNINSHRKKIGKPILESFLNFFNEVIIRYIEDKNKLVGIDILCFEPKFKVNKLSSRISSKGFIKRYINFLQHTLMSLARIFENDKIKYKLRRVINLDINFDQYIREDIPKESMKGKLKSIAIYGKNKTHILKIGKKKTIIKTTSFRVKRKRVDF